MKQLETLVQTLEHQNSIKKDYLAAPDSMHFVDGQFILTAGKKEIVLNPSTTFYAQMADYTEIPKKYFDKVLAHDKTLFDENVNYWLKKTEEKRLVRTFQDAGDNTARAFLSDSYNIIDNFEILMEALEALRQTGLNIEIVGAELSDKRMYLNVICPDVEIQGKEFLKDYTKANGAGFGIYSGFCLSNSEVGQGCFMLAPRAMVGCCSNGLVMPKDNMKRIHLGARMDELNFHKNKAVTNANSRLIKEQVKHAVKQFLSKDYLTKVVDFYTKAGQPEITAPVTGIIEIAGKEYGWTAPRKENILRYFIKGGDTHRSGLVHAITEELQDHTDADLKNESEVVAFEVLQNFTKIEAAAMKIKPSAN